MMRILFLSNFYAPTFVGGWEQLCQETVNALMARGHQVAVLTSRYRRETISEPEPHVQRVLYLESDLQHYKPLDFFLRLPWRDQHNRQCMTELVKEFRPDVIFVWGMWQLNAQLAVLAEDLCPDRVAYYLCGYWPSEPDVHTSYWNAPETKPLVQLIKRPVALLATSLLARARRRSPDLKRAACVSYTVLNILREAGLELPTARVIYNGIQLDRFYHPLDAAHFRRKPLRLLYAGAIVPHKGVDSAVRATIQLSSKYGPDVVNLTIVGDGNRQYEEDLRHLVQSYGIQAYVTFQGKVAREMMPSLLERFDVLLFTSTYQEPLARMMMEGMASGLVLISTTTGGSKEFLKHACNGLAFKAGDAEDLAKQIERLLNEPDLPYTLALAGQQTALSSFDFNRMVGEMESFLKDVVAEKG